MFTTGYLVTLRKGKLVEGVRFFLLSGCLRHGPVNGGGGRRVEGGEKVPCTIGEEVMCLGGGAQPPITSFNLAGCLFVLKFIRNLASWGGGLRGLQPPGSPTAPPLFPKKKKKTAAAVLK